MVSGLEQGDHALCGLLAFPDHQSTTNYKNNHQAQGWAGLGIVQFIDQDCSPASKIKDPYFLLSLQILQLHRRSLK